MENVFGLFNTYEATGAAVQSLLGRRFRLEAMNILLQDTVAKSHLGKNLQRATWEIQHLPPGLDKLVMRERPVLVPDVGTLYAAGETATMLAKTAATLGGTRDGLYRALLDFGLPREIAEIFRNGVRSGTILFWVKAEGDQVSDAAQVLRDYKGEPVVSLAAARSREPVV